ncbi:probable glycosyltransferase At3g07620 [Rhododendron vialii]|uniref:probable glycosyltransferase At3g07620 n=1 Tax=Rhododendron vialii TaxID=182163 RepID=UPI00265E5839|nr:probable glycosyltransferase At3g07620 [Rhododendron vialii]
MGHKSKVLWQFKARILVWLIGMVFSIWLIDMGQYFELPFGSRITSRFSAGNISSNMTIFNDLNSTATENYLHFDNTIKPSEGEDSGSENNFVPEKNGGSDDSFKLEADTDPADESPSVDFVELNDNSTVDISIAADNRLAPGKARESAYSFFAPNNAATDGSSSLGSTTSEESNGLTEEENGGISATPANINSHSPIISVYPNTSLVDKDTGNVIAKDEKSKEVQRQTVLPENSSSKNNVSAPKGGLKQPAVVVSISEMNDLLLQSHASSFSTKPQWPSAVDQDLQNARLQIANAPVVVNDPTLYAPLYRNVSMFKRSYELMEKMLKVYIYKEGGRPIFHQPVLKGIYASEGWFMKLMESNKHLVTKDPRKAHLFYLPFSSRMLELTLYVPDSHSKKNLIEHLKNYLDMIAARHSFWNRTAGADHFLVACHDWALSETNQHMGNCLRALCNSDVEQGFRFGKDVSLPETSVRSPNNPLLELGGKPPSQRRILAFFAGSMHGYLRPVLLQHWQDKDPDMKIFGLMRDKVNGKVNYVEHMKSSKYCICPKGYEVNSPRVVEAIFYECVPVIISDNFVPPFFDILNWESFAVFVPEKDIPNLKSILLSIPQKKYLEMRKRVKKVQKHFLWHPRPVKYDIFHMILHSIWYNRVFRP